MIMLSVMFLSACGGSGVYVNRGTGKVWYVDDSGGVQTNDLVRLQQATPFTIVIPSYLPVEVSSAPVMFIKTIGIRSEDDVDVRFSYWNSPKGVTIKETDYPSDLIPNPGYSYIQINNINVLQMPSKNFVGSVTVDVYSYAWDKGGVSFTVDVWDYSEAESRKTVGSMIK